VIGIVFTKTNSPGLAPVLYFSVGDYWFKPTFDGRISNKS